MSWSLLKMPSIESLSNGEEGDPLVLGPSREPDGDSTPQMGKSILLFLWFLRGVAYPASCSKTIAGYV